MNAHIKVNDSRKLTFRISEPNAIDKRLVEFLHHGQWFFSERFDPFNHGESHAVIERYLSKSAFDGNSKAKAKQIKILQRDIQKESESNVAVEAGLLPSIKCVTELMEDNPVLRKPVIFGLLREGEICNVIASPKMGKTWWVLYLAISVALGLKFLCRFDCNRGKVLILDNELHKETMSQRISLVCEAAAIDRERLAGNLFIDCLRGRLVDLMAMERFFEAIEPGEYKMIVLDAFYRFLPVGTSENDNGSMMQLYNILDRHAKRLECSFVLIHHSSKGNQAGKSITDVGAGAGSMSRATDTHLIIRKHAEEGLFVLDAAVRSWAPLDPMSMRFSFPLWYPDDTAPVLDTPKSPNSQKIEQQRRADVVAVVDHFKKSKPGKPIGWVDVKNLIGCGESRATNILLEAVKLKHMKTHKKMKRKHSKKRTMTYLITPTTTDNDNGNDNVPVSVPVT